VRPGQFGERRRWREALAFDWTPAPWGIMLSDVEDANVEGHMRSKIAIAGTAMLFGAVMLGTPANALRLHDDIYYYGSVTPRFGHTPSHPFGAYWLYARPHCARYQQFLPMTGGVVYHGLPCR
jgi:hypothetical protein